MGTLSQRKNFKIRFPCSKKLLTKFQDMIKKRKINPNDLLLTLIKKVRRPTEIQNHYQQQFKNKTKKRFDARVTEQTYIDFEMFAIFFKTKSLALDYLISNEIDPVMDLTYSDNEAMSL